MILKQLGQGLAADFSKRCTIENVSRACRLQDVTAIKKPDRDDILADSG